MSTFQFFVNGDWIEFDDFDKDCTLAHALRDRLCLTGTKIACGEGGCGSCTVIVSKFDRSSKAFRHFPLNACITPIYSVYGCHILTIEGLGSNDGKYVDPIQDALVRANGLQCGFCTPGMALTIFGLHTQLQKEVGIGDIKRALAGNLCRCTGYRPIIQAAVSCTRDCAKCSTPCENATAQDIEDHDNNRSCLPEMQSHFEGVRKVQDTSKKIFDIEKIIIEFNANSSRKSLQFNTPQGVWSVPHNLEKLRKALTEFPNASIAGGSVSLSIQNNSTRDVIDVSELKEMKLVTLEDSCLKLGAGLTISEAEKEIEKTMRIVPSVQCGILDCCLKCFENFGSLQIRNAATIGGNIDSPKNYSDLQTFCTGFGVIISYLKVFDNEDENNQKIISHIAIPFTQKNEVAFFDKISRRKDCDTAILNIAIKYNTEEQELFVTFGGLTVNRFSVRIRIDEYAEEIEKNIAQNFTNYPLYDLCYVQILAKNLVKKFILKVKEDWPTPTEKNPFTFKASQIFPSVEPDADGVSRYDLVHKAIPHASSYKHTTGQSIFADDIPKFHNELELAFVLSERAHAKILRVDYSKALELDGVVGTISSKDLSSDCNKFGLIERDEEIFASEKVTAVGQIIAGILANDRLIARTAAKLVKVEYEDIIPPILTIEDAISHDSMYHKYGSTLRHGNSKAVFCTSPYIISSEVRVGSQEHFYMEPHSCIAYPKGEDGEMEIISSTQNPTGVQMQAALCLGIPANRITVKVKRIGGGFGGKEVRCLMVALPTAIAAQRFGKPVRCILDRKMDMKITGKRHFYHCIQKIAFNELGKLLALKASVYCNAGNSLDVSMAPIERVMLNLDNAYNIPNMDYDGFICKTNIPSNSVMRGTGGPQAVFLMENIMDIIASTLDKDPVQIREMQLYSEGDVTPYGQELRNSNIRKCWEQCLKQSKYYEMRSQIDKFNSENKYVKRGISINPCHFGVGYTALHLNQGSALVHIYTDGSVMISHGGVELGQGVHTKMIQVATRELGIPSSKIRIVETGTDKVPNSTPSSASVTSDLNGMAVLAACRKLVKRLQPYWIQNPDGNWEVLVSRAYLDGVHLSAQGHYKAPHLSWDGKRGSPFTYFSTGTAASIVELDCLTGTVQVLRTDIVMDVGKSLNPSIDIGQIEGAFVQGIGLFLMEQVVFNEKGELITADVSTYKIPTASNAPLEFNVAFLTESENPRAIYSSKTVGEPPLLLATSPFFALKDAIRAFRKSNGHATMFHMDSPATVQSILMACQGQ